MRIALYKLGRKLRHFIAFSGAANVEGDVAGVDVVEFAEAINHCLKSARAFIHQHSDAPRWHALLRAAIPS